jgi:hypothetical protein
VQFLVMVKATATSEAGQLPTKDDLVKMGAFNETLAHHGAILALGGLQPSAKGVRIDYSGTKPHVIDGPFAETKELVAGFWILEARSKAELVERFLSCPFQHGEGVEIRPLFSPEDLGGIA